MYLSLAKPYNPIDLSKIVEAIVIDGNRRKYNTFRLEPFYGGIATARGIGCNLECIFCWINPSKDEPEKYGKFYSPKEVYEKLLESASDEKGELTARWARISGCEPLIGKNHLFDVIDIAENEGAFGLFLIETNGMLLGEDEELAKELGSFGDYIHVRLSFKAGTPEAFQRKTGAEAKYFKNHFRALEYLKKYSIPYNLAAMSKNPELMPPDERRALMSGIVAHGFDNIGRLDEEKADLFSITKKRLIESGIAGDIKSFGGKVYEPLKHSLVRAIAEEGNNGAISTEEDAEKALIKLLETCEFRLVDSPCNTCTSNNPWHGHGAEDDLDSVLTTREY